MTRSAEVMNKSVITCLVTVLMPSLVLCHNCPPFQSVIPLRPLATAYNWSYAVVADGKYYLVGVREPSRRQVEGSGDMPLGFEDSRLTVVIDGLDCGNQSNYYLITIKSFRLSDNSLQTNYSTLDLMSWSESSQWSEPMAISRHPMLWNDPFIKILSQFVPIEDFIHTVFYWHQRKSMFFVTKFIGSPTLQFSNKSSLYYYSVNTSGICRHNYVYPEETENLKTGLNSVIGDLKNCFFSHQREGSNGLLYCIGDHSFQVNAVIAIQENGTLRTETIVSSQQKPTIDTLRVLDEICPQHESNRTIELVINEVIRFKDMRTDQRVSARKTTESSDQEEESSGVYVLVIVVVIVVLLVIAGVAAAVRSHRLLGK